MAVQMSVPLELIDNVYTKEASVKKINTIVEIPENENILVYEENSTYGGRSIIEVIEFMAEMIELADREIISHNVAYLYIKNPLAHYNTKPEMKYYISIILKPAK